MYSLGFFLTSIFYSFLLGMEYVFYPNNFFILVLSASSVLLLVPIKINFKWLTCIYLSIIMAINLNFSTDILGYLGNNKVLMLISLSLIGIYLGTCDSKGIIGIFSFFLFVVLMLFIFVILSNIKTFEKPIFKIDYKFLLIPFDLAILNIIRPKEINKYVLPIGLVVMSVLLLLGQIITYSHFGDYIFDFENQSIMVFKLQNLYDELGGYDFLLAFIMPILCIFRIGLGLSIIKKMNIKMIIPILLALLFLFVKIDVLFLIILGVIIYIGGIYGHYREIQK